MIDRNLERLLSETARGIEYPRTPEQRNEVVLRARLPVSNRRVLMQPGFALSLLVAAVVLLAALVITPSREAIARLFGVEGSRIEFLPTPLPGEIPTPFPTPNLAVTPDPRSVRPVDLEMLPVLVGFAGALPRVAEERIESSLLFYGHDAVVVHTYAGFDLWQSRLEGYASFGKLAPSWLRVQEVEVGEWDGVWLSGGEHFVSYMDSRGNVLPASERIVERSTLIWRTDAFFYRIETDMSRHEAIRIAETLP